jgi:hypothetical protein
MLNQIQSGLTSTLERRFTMPNYTVELTEGEVSTILFYLEVVVDAGECPEEIQTIFSKLEGAVDAYYERRSA